MWLGESATRTPASSSATRLDSAVPAPPEMMAPAWPMRRPGGAVRPAMKAAIGLRTSRAQKAAARLLLLAADLADHHDRLGLGVLVEHVEDVDEVGADDRVAADADAGGLADAGIGQGLHDLVGQRAGSADQPDRPAAVDVAGNDPDLRLARRVVMPGQFGPTSRTPCLLEDVVHAQHVEGRDALGDAEDQRRCPPSAASSIASGAKAAGTKMQLVLAPVSRDGLGDGVEDRHRPSSADCPPLPGVTPATMLRAVVEHGGRVELAFAAGDALDQEPRVAG